jgi:hypothetical protein
MLRESKKKGVLVFMGVRRVFRALAFLLIFAATITALGSTAQAASDEDKNIEVSAKDGLVKFTFSEEAYFFNNFKTDYVIQQGSDAISFVKNTKKGKILKKQYGFEFKTASSGNVRILLAMRDDQGKLEEAILYDISIDEDNNVSYEKLEHVTPSYAAKKGVANKTKKLLIDDYGFSEEDLDVLG